MTMTSRLRLWIYLAPILLMPVAIFSVAVLVVPTDWLGFRSNSEYILTSGWGAELHNADCSILLYGDSTALVGLNPILIQKRTGLTACNIAEIEGMSAVNGTMVLDQYLAHNPKPQVLLIQFAPENFDPSRQRDNPDITKFEAIRYLLRQPNKLESLLQLSRRPEELMKWSEQGTRMIVSAIRSKPFPPATRFIRYSTQGQLSWPDPSATGCFYPSHAYPPDRAWVQELRSKYASQGIKVIVVAMQLPDCDPDLQYYRHELAGVIDNNPIKTLPPNVYYVEDGVSRHVNKTGSALLSEAAADQILNHLQAAATQKP